MEKLSLQQIAAAIGADYRGDTVYIENICTDTRKIQKGCLFIAFEGEKFDAHAFALQAQEQGAAALICHKKVACSVPVLYVKNTRDAYLALAGYYRSLFHIPLVGVTGSVGKTTTKEFIALALSAKFKTLKTEGNLNNDIGMPTTLLRLDNTYQAAVVEMGMNHFGEIHNLVMQCKPTMGVITNIGVSHIENLGSRDGILKAKLELLDGMDENAPLLLNADNDKLAGVQLPGRTVYYYSIHDTAADFKAEEVKTQASDTQFLSRYADGLQPVTIPTVGEHNVLNAVCAFAVGVLNGIDPQAVAKKLAEYVPAGMRQKIVDCGTFTVIEDCYNASPDSMAAAIGTLTHLPARKKIAVLADMLELGEYAKEFHEKVGTVCAENGVDVLLAYGENAIYYCQAAKAGGLQHAEHFESKEKLLDALLEQTDTNSAVLFKGSHGMHLDETINALYERKGIKHE